MHSILASSHSLRAAVAAPLASSNRRAIKSRAVMTTRATPAAKEEHFEPAEPRGECLLEDARDAIEACKNLPAEDEAACMLALGCDAEAVHKRLDNEEEAAAATAAAATEKK